MPQSKEEKVEFGTELQVRKLEKVEPGDPGQMCSESVFMSLAKMLVCPQPRLFYVPTTPFQATVVPQPGQSCPVLAMGNVLSVFQTRREHLRWAQGKLWKWIILDHVRWGLP